VPVLMARIGFAAMLIILQILKQVQDDNEGDSGCDQNDEAKIV